MRREDDSGQMTVGRREWLIIRVIIRISNWVNLRAGRFLSHPNEVERFRCKERSSKGGFDALICLKVLFTCLYSKRKG
jgi:hypothetical protein